jgi:hypothetical protein
MYPLSMASGMVIGTFEQHRHASAGISISALSDRGVHASVTGRAAEKLPRGYAFVANRLTPRRFDGLPLTLIVVAALYFIFLLGALIEDVLDQAGHRLRCRCEPLL